MGRQSVTMKTINQAFSVAYSYPVVFTHGVFSSTNATLAKILMKSRSGQRTRTLVVVDAGLASATPELTSKIERYFRKYSHELELVRSPMIVPGGENAKNGWNSVREIMTAAGVDHLDRQSCVIATGGGSVLDMAGFASSLVHRGLRFVRIPSTVLAQNDAGVGVKNGMNDGGSKNFAGTFYPPHAVIDDFELLKTLPQREWVGGLTESFKVAIIKDKPFFLWLCNNAKALRRRNQKLMEQAIHKTAALHLHHIATAGDPFEHGSARPLDFGHWAAHRLELMSDFTLGHGHAVAIGIALDSTYAMLKRFITTAERQAILHGLTDCGLPVWSPLLNRQAPNGEPDVLAGLEQFREHLGGRLCVTLPAPLGSKREVHTINLALMKNTLSLLKLETESCAV
ncbi:MAG: 3-dehydroquinate synthase [Kiritimatiellae bacterium]|nr:3-dehydroquinate synthase [Kiritimatiellia bacterium]